MRALATLITLVLPFAGIAQNDECDTAPPYPSTLPYCTLFSATDTATVCFAFTAPTGDILFDAIITSSCVLVSREFVLYDGECTPLDTSSTGYFSTTVGLPYRVCVRLVCTGGTGIQGVCVVDPLPLYATVIAISGGIEHGQLYMRWVSVDIQNTHYRVMRSMDMAIWEEVGWRDAHGAPGEPASYTWVGDALNGVNYLRLYDGHDVLLGQVAVPFLSMHKDIRYNVLGQRIR